MPLNRQKYCVRAYAEALALVLAGHKTPLIASLILVPSCTLFFSLSGAFLPLAWGCLLSSLFLVLSSGRFTIQQLRHASRQKDFSTATATKEVPRPTLPFAGSLPAHTSFPVPQQGAYGTAVDPHMTRIAASPPMSALGKRQLQASSRTDPGIMCQDRPNEDATLALVRACGSARPIPLAGIFVVADGMGGHAKGQVASRLAIQSLFDVVAPILTRPVVDPSHEERLKQGALQANLAIYQQNSQGQQRATNGGRHMMGSTMTAALVIDTVAYIVNVGDSRTYHYQPFQGLRKLTNDHSLVASMASAGVIKPDEIYTHPQRNQIYRCLQRRAQRLS